MNYTFFNNKIKNRGVSTTLSLYWDKINKNRIYQLKKENKEFCNLMNHEFWKWMKQNQGLVSVQQMKNHFIGVDDCFIKHVLISEFENTIINLRMMEF